MLTFNKELLVFPCINISADPRGRGVLQTLKDENGLGNGNFKIKINKKFFIY